MCLWCRIRRARAKGYCDLHNTWDKRNPPPWTPDYHHQPLEAPPCTIRSSSSS